jgi:protein-disulfide isomerase
VAVAEWGLGRGEAAGSGNILGLSPARPAGGEGGSEADRYREEARAASEEARRLQEILDDPNKLERYFADKAAREFEQAPVHPLDLANVPVKGPPPAPVKVVEFSDFLCPFCRQVAGAFDAYLPGSAGRVAIFYKNYPLDPSCNPNIQGSGHAGSCSLALGGLCAQDQGKFWPYHDRVFAAQNELHNPQASDVLRLAAEAGLDTTALGKCLESGATRQRLTAQINEAQKGGVNATPTLFINGKRLPRLADFEATVNKEATRLGAGIPPPALQR